MKTDLRTVKTESKIAVGFRRLFRLEANARDVERSLDDELTFHFDMTVRELVAKGMSDEDAHREASRRFGDVSAARARMSQLDRERLGAERRAAWWSALKQDAHYAFRGLRRRPGFAIAVIVTLGLGIGANAAMFGIVDRLFFRAPSYMASPDRVHRVFLYRTVNGEERPSQNFSYRRIREADSLTRSFDLSAAHFATELAVGSGIDAGEQPVVGASGNFFKLFDAQPALGRFYDAREDTIPQGSPVVVLSYGYWQLAYGGRREVINEKIKIGDEVFTIVGVAPPRFAEEFSSAPPVVFIPITRMATLLFGKDAVPRYYTTNSYGWTSMLVRRREGVSVEAASRDLTTAFIRSYEKTVEENPGSTPVASLKLRAVAASVLTERGPGQGADSKVATWLEGVAFIVLLIACANVANLLLARAVDRRREIAVRLALGISRTRLIVQLLIESSVLALLGGLAGLALAQWGGATLRVMFLPNAAWAMPIADPRTIAFTFSVAAVAALLSGVAPALFATKADVASSLKAGVREGSHRSRSRALLLIAQGALSVVLLVGAGLFVRSLTNVNGLHIGYDVDKILVVMPQNRGIDMSARERKVLRERLLARAKETPGVENATRALTVPFWMTISGDLRIEGVDTSATWLGDVTRQAGSPSFFETMGTRILKGRGITAADRDSAQLVVVVSKALADKAWPGRDALGQCVRISSDTAPCRTVVGVAENIMRDDIRKDTGLHYYVPIDQYAQGQAGGLFVRVRGTAERGLEMVRRSLQAEMPGESYVNVFPLGKMLSPQTRSWRLGATMFVVFGALALGLAAIGLYSVIAYSVSQRQHELGVRVALGARAGQIVTMVLRQGVIVATIGVAIGTAFALGAGKWIEPLLYGVSPYDPVVIGGVVVLLLVTALVACLVPAKRASKVEGSLVLRGD